MPSIEDVETTFLGKVVGPVFWFSCNEEIYTFGS